MRIAIDDFRDGFALVDEGGVGIDDPGGGLLDKSE